MFTLGNLSPTSPLLLAPLAGYSDLPFRLLCREHGAGLCYSEMISCHGLCYKQKKTLAMLKSCEEERPVAFQLFGAEVEMMADAADILNEFKPDIIDINMGCPVKKVTKKGAGAALMATPDLARKIIGEVVNRSNVPVTVKFRLGVDSTSITCLDFARMAEDSGASAVIVHGRTWTQGFKGEANWNFVRKVKEVVSIPVIGNGDIHCHQQAMKFLEEDFCDAVMIGRGALGNPWIFNSHSPAPTPASITTTALRHLELMHRYIDTNRLLAVIKNHIGRYFKGIQGSASVRRKIYDSKSFAEIRCSLEEIAEAFPEE